MSEIVGDKGKTRKIKDTVPVETGPIEIEEPAGFSPEEIARLIKVKQDIAGGRYSDITNEHKKLLFAQWLVQHGKLNE